MKFRCGNCICENLTKIVFWWPTIDYEMKFRCGNFMSENFTNKYWIVVVVLLAWKEIVGDIFSLFYKCYNNRLIYSKRTCVNFFMIAKYGTELGKTPLSSCTSWKGPYLASPWTHCLQMMMMLSKMVSSCNFVLKEISLAHWITTLIWLM